jgi:FkbM family methyltransferase
MRTPLSYSLPALLKILSFRVGSYGRWVLSRTFGSHARLKCGLRIKVHDPAEYIHKEIIENGEYEPEISRLIDSLVDPEDLCIDIGANVGCHSLQMAFNGALVFAFEPVPRIAASLRRNIAINRLETRIHIIQEAVGEASYLSDFFVAKRDDDGSHSLIEGVLAASVSTIQVYVTTLDDFLTENRLPHPALIKIDVEGAESLVLEGAKSSISTEPSPIWIIESGDRLSRRIGESAFSALARFLTHGYSIYEIYSNGKLQARSKESIKGDLANYLVIHPLNTRINRIQSMLATQ